MFESASASLDTLAELLASGAREGAMIGSLVPGREDDLYALDDDGTLLLLLLQEDDAIGSGLFRKYEAIRLMPTALYEVEVDGVRTRRSYRALGLLPDYRHLVSAFAYLTASMLSVLPQRPRPKEVDEFLGTLVDLLRSPSGVPESIMKGLWGELWLVSKSTRVPEWVQAWHSKPASLYDFAFSNGYVEVKTHEGVHPRHRFSHEQLVPRPLETVVASVLVYHDESGDSLADLMTTIADCLSMDGKAVFLEKCLRVMGSAAEAADQLRFTVRNQESQTVIGAKWIPKISDPDDAISEIRYTVDLTLPLAARGSRYSDLYESFPGSAHVADA